MSTYTPIASQTLGSAASSVTFSSIPQGYTDLIVVVNAICASGGTDLINLQYNGDTSSGLYSSTRLVGNGSTVNSDRQTGGNFIYAGLINSTVRNSDIYQIQNYSNGTTFKTCLARAGVADNQTRATVGLWRNTNAITSVTISHASSINFSSGSTFSIYGIQVGDKAQKAQGGNIVTTDGTYVYHTFTSSGSFIPSEALTVDYLVVAGGGGGGTWTGGGGGAGGLRSTVTATGGGGSLETALTLSLNTNYTVTIGAGGIGTNSRTTDATAGGNSVFSTITSTGGGKGGSLDTIGGGNYPGGPGGSGGGGAGSGQGAGGTRTASPVQGFNGEIGTAGSPFFGGGGGGAGEAGGTDNVAEGGDGVAVSISGSSVTYAGGGGGAPTDSGGGSKSGGTGGGGAGGASAAAGTAGTANTGGGGGGGSNSGGNARAGGNGGSGIVIIRYAV